MKTHTFIRSLFALGVMAWGLASLISTEVAAWAGENQEPRLSLAAEHVPTKEALADPLDPRDPGFASQGERLPASPASKP
ncbi:hypothetical protein [Singulisphaera sp. PoT]|uniref:hypothetical protein n=1 Tax=Singulisphaera sp. PoT TaxID=3411797 RepID=UPI003BF50793